MFWLIKKIISIAFLVVVLYFVAQVPYKGEPLGQHAVDFLKEKGAWEKCLRIKNNVDSVIYGSDSEFKDKDQSDDDGEDKDSDSGQIHSDESHDLEKVIQKEKK